MITPVNEVLVINGQPFKLVWNKRAMFRADELGVFGKRKPGIGLAIATKYVWCMLPDTGREAFPTVEDLAEALPPLGVVWLVVNAVLEKGQEDSALKNVFGSTSGPSPASS